MGRTTIEVIKDDFDGKELPAETQAVNLSIGSKRYMLYLSDQNHGKLLDLLQPFIENAEIAYDHKEMTKHRNSFKAADKEHNAKVRHWAIQTGYEYENAQKKMVKLGDRGRIPDVVVKAWEAAGSPDIPSASRD